VNRLLYLEHREISHHVHGNRSGRVGLAIFKGDDAHRRTGVDHVLVGQHQIAGVEHDPSADLDRDTAAVGGDADQTWRDALGQRDQIWCRDRRGPASGDRGWIGGYLLGQRGRRIGHEHPDNLIGRTTGHEQRTQHSDRHAEYQRSAGSRTGHSIEPAQPVAAAGAERSRITRMRQTAVLWCVPVTSVLDRLIAAGLSEERARWHLARGAVRVDGNPTTDPETPAPAPSRLVLQPPPIERAGLTRAVVGR
jgi:hypothetical protein